ncbi:MAG: FKBP-type peptidyl-prolyl cis-trans isomerase [Bacteroidales bacterium]|nr:FKBP-type peptidyl-prolyl cis-trans isomerase [Bacteroidales bacterium]
MKHIFFTVVYLLIVNIQMYSQMDKLQQTPSGLMYSILKKGNGNKPEPGDKVFVHYVGKLMNDTVFDSSYKRGEPFAFNLGEGRVIKGWDEGIALLNEGDSALLIIPPDLAYGNRAIGNIPANSTLKFIVTLEKIEKAPKIEPYDIKNKEIETLESGLKIIRVNKPNKNAEKPSSGDIVEVHYTGYFEDGKIFDSSVRRGQPISFTLGKGQVIKGWDEGISKLAVGEKARLIIPYNLAYGENGRPPVIPPKADLTFDVELINIHKQVTPTPFDTKGKDTIKTASGLQYIIVQKAKNNAPKAEPGKMVKVHYTGYFKDGKIFDSSVQRGQPFSFKLGSGMVIKGWDEGVALMKVGEKFRFIVPYQLAYGENGYPGAIPPKTDLIFDVELLEVN